MADGQAGEVGGDAPTAAAAGSCSSASWSPSTPAATMTRSMSPKRSKTSSAKAPVAGDVGGVEGHGLDHVGPERPWPGGRLGQPGPVPAGQDHRPAAGRDQPGHDGLGDLGGAPEHED